MLILIIVFWLAAAIGLTVEVAAFRRRGGRRAGEVSPDLARALRDHDGADVRDCACRGEKPEQEGRGERLIDAAAGRAGGQRAVSAQGYVPFAGITPELCAAEDVICALGPLDETTRERVLDLVAQHFESGSCRLGPTD